MRRRFLAGAALLCLVALPATALPEAAPDLGPGKRPGVVLRVQPIDELLANAKYLAALAGQDEQAKQFEGFIRSMAGKELGGIDTKRPIALYGTVGPNGIDSTAVLLVPIADEKAVLDLLERFQLKPEKGKDGLYTLKTEDLPVPIYFRFANQHAYVTAQDESAIAKDKLLAPQAVHPPGQGGVLSASVNLAEIPDNLRQMAIQQLQEQLDEAKKQRDPNETDAQHKFKGQTIDAMREDLVSLIRDGDHVTLSFNIDRAKHDISLDLSLAGKRGSRLATTIAGLAQAKSTVAGLVGKDSSLGVVAYAAMPEELRKAMGPVLEEAIKESLEQEKDPAKRALAARLAKVLTPTLKAAELDFAADLRGPSDKQLYTGVVGLKVKDGAEIEKALRDLVKDLPEAEKAKIKLDADQAGAVKIHRLDIQKDADEDFRKSFGDNPLYVAIRNDAAFAAVGEKGLAAVKEAVAVTPKAAVPLRMEVSMARLAAAIEVQQKGAVKAAEEIFGKGKAGDKITLSIEGGDLLTLRFGMKAPVIQFLAKIAELQAGAQ